VTEQEREVLSLLARGCGTGEIAGRLDVSAPRVCQVKDSIAEKLVGFFG
jgi:DNA-binding NarL/FixJ family response regulator